MSTETFVFVERPQRTDTLRAKKYARSRLDPDSCQPVFRYSGFGSGALLWVLGKIPKTCVDVHRCTACKFCKWYIKVCPLERFRTPILPLIPLPMYDLSPKGTGTLLRAVYSFVIGS